MDLHHKRVEMLWNKRQKSKRDKNVTSMSRSFSSVFTCHMMKKKNVVLFNK
uniref:Uncharacterized protein n=1 Tax=Arion vulgaris TaxID=1028688 RepID=A0A0B7B8P9_9EUPU